MLQLQVFWSELTAYLKSLDKGGRFIQIALLVIGALNVLTFFFQFNFFNLVIAAIDFGLVYFGYKQYANSLPNKTQPSDSSLEA